MPEAYGFDSPTLMGYLAAKTDKVEIGRVEQHLRDLTRRRKQMVGCAAERDPINRVQLNAIPKSFLVGANYTDAKDDPEFYARSMLIKVPYGQSGGDAELFTNSINSVSKIKWQVQETKLVGRVSFERVNGTDQQGLANPIADQADPTKPLAQNDGLVVYEFAIEKQFDIRRAYNAQTGEESNVVEENDQDRAWVDRDYVRVDFSGQGAGPADGCAWQCLRTA